MQNIVTTNEGKRDIMNPYNPDDFRQDVNIYDIPPTPSTPGTQNYDIGTPGSESLYMLGNDPSGQNPPNF